MSWQDGWVKAWWQWTQRGGAAADRQTLEFLPAALEIQANPPHPASRITATLLVSLFTIGVIWACLGKVDIVATAEGKIVPSGQVKQIQPYERSVIKNILVKEGELVSKGQPLIELDRGQTGADQKRLELALQLNRLTQQRLNYLQSYLALYKPALLAEGRFPDITVPYERERQQLLAESARLLRAESYFKLRGGALKDPTQPILPGGGDQEGVNTDASGQPDLQTLEHVRDQQWLNHIALYELTQAGNSPAAEQQRLLLQQQQNGIQSQLQQFGQQLAEQEAQRRANQARINQLKATLPLITERVDGLKTLLQKKMAARNKYLELEQQRLEQQQALIVFNATDQQINAKIEEIRQQRRTFIVNSQSRTLQELLENDREYRSLSEELNKARDLNRKQVLYAPVAGIVKALAVHTVGGVVTQAQILMTIVPQDSQLEVEAWLENKDIGFIYPDQPAEIKVHTFPFTQYGIINGFVARVAPDAAADERRGLIYKAKVLLAKHQLRVDGRDVPLVPGMGVSVEIKIGKRRLIEYLTAPLLRYKDESLQEK